MPLGEKLRPRMKENKFVILDIVPNVEKKSQDFEVGPRLTKIVAECSKAGARGCKWCAWPCCKSMPLMGIKTWREEMQLLPNEAVDRELLWIFSTLHSFIMCQGWTN